MIYSSVAIAIYMTNVVLSCNQNVPTIDHCCHEFFAGNKSCRAACLDILQLRKFNRTSITWRKSQQLYMKCKITSAEFANCLVNTESKFIRQPISTCLPELNFCRNFFQFDNDICALTCDHNADRAARASFRYWSRSLVFSTQNSIDSIRLRSVDQCRPGRWRFLACTLSIRPFSKEVGSWAICRDDCVDLLISCSDAPIDTQTIHQICDRISVKHRKCFPFDEVPFLDFFTFESNQESLDRRRLIRDQSSAITENLPFLLLLLPVIFIFVITLISRYNLRVRRIPDQIGTIDSV